MYHQKWKIAQRRLQRDLIELQRENIVSIAAQPLDDNIFEWHVNLQPSDGVYSGVYFHLILDFPDNYPTKPPTVKICTAISHPNIFGSSLCLSMLRPYTSNVPYEGWSGAYSATSILMQLQSFLFAEKIDQDGGYQANAKLSNQDVARSIKICKQFTCDKCGHSHNSPWPAVKGPPEALIKVYPTDPESNNHVIVQGSSCQTTHTYWVGAYGEFGCRYGKVFYEAYISWIGDEWSPTNIKGGLSRFGFGTENAVVCGRCPESFGYDGTGNYSHNNKFDAFSEWFTKGDTITVAVDFDNKRIYFGKNGRLLEPDKELYIPNYLQGKHLYPLLSFKNTRAEFNFGRARKPIKWLEDMGFCNLEHALKQTRNYQNRNKNKNKGKHRNRNKDDDDSKEIEDKTAKKVDWDHYGIIDELWVWIFEALQVHELFSAQFVCKKWHKILSNFNCMERNDIYCYYTKARLDDEILGIGLYIRPKPDGHGVDFGSQMDILSLNAWENGCKTGVWGEQLTHFLPLVMNRKHAEIADDAIHQYLEKIKMEYKRIKDEQHVKKHANKPNYQQKDKKAMMNMLDKYIDGNGNLQLVDTLVTMMNQIVCQFVIGNDNADSKKVSMVMCEKVVLGYCALHHLLLYLADKHKVVVKGFADRFVSHFINDPNGSHKSECRDLGKLLIYLMISDKYSWKDVAAQYVRESFTRRVRWMIKQEQYKQYDTTNYVEGRLRDTYISSKTGRRLVMFQVWFMKNNANETLKGYNQRLGRPRKELKKGIVRKTKFILNSRSWWEYFDELDVIIKDENAIDQLLRFAVYNSEQAGYHYRRHNYNNNKYGYNGRGRGRGRGRGGYNYQYDNAALPIHQMRAPRIAVKGVKEEPAKVVPNRNSYGVKTGRGGSRSGSSFKGWGSQNNNNLRQSSSWNGRGRGGGGRPRGRGRGNGPRPYYQQRPVQGQGRGFIPRGPPQNNMNQYQAPSRPPQAMQYQMNRNINNNNNNIQIQRQQPMMAQIPNPNQNQYRAPVTPPQQMYQQAVTPQIQNVNVMNNNNRPSMHVNNTMNMNGNMIQRPSQVQQQRPMQPQQVQPQQYQNVTPPVQNIVNRNYGQNHVQNQTQQYQAPTAHYQQQRVPPMIHNGNMNNVNLNTNMIQRPITQTPPTPQVQNIPLCSYYHSAVGCALGQSCNYRH